MLECVSCEIALYDYVYCTIKFFHVLILDLINFEKIGL